MISDSGILFKRYPCCAAAHVPVACAIRLATEHCPALSDIDRIDVQVSHHVKTALVHHSAKTPAEARFCLEYCIARALLDGELGPRQFEADLVGADEVADLISRMRIDYYQEVRTGARASGPDVTSVAVTTAGGKTVRVDASEELIDDIKNPGSESISIKFAECCDGILDAGVIAELSEILAGFEAAEDVGTMMSLLGAEQ